MSHSFERGTFVSYRATNDIHVGKHSFSIKKNTTFEYDGSDVVYDGTVYAGVPQLKGTFGSWFVPASDTTSGYRSQTAPVLVSPASGQGAPQRMGTASEEEGVVNTIEKSEAFRKASGEDPVLAAKLRQQQLAEARARAAKATSQAGMSVPPSESEVASAEKADSINQARIAKMLETLKGAESADNAGSRYKAGREVEDGTVVARYQFSDGASVGGIGEAVSTVKPVNVTGVGVQPVQVGRAVVAVEKRVRDTGAQFFDTIVDDVSLLGSQGSTSDTDVTLTVHEEDDLPTLLPDAAVAGGLKKPPARKSEAEEVQEVIDGWEKNRHWKKRVEEAVEFYGEWPAVLDAICEIESPAVANQIRTRIAEKR